MPKTKKSSRSVKRFNMDVTDAEMRAIKKAAAAKEMTMSAWARLTLLKAAG